MNTTPNDDVKDDEGDWPPCGYPCSHAGCSGTCTKAGSPTHQAYGTHSCGKH